MYSSFVHTGYFRKVYQSLLSESCRKATLFISIILNVHNDPCFENKSSSLTLKYRPVQFSENSCSSLKSVHVWEAKIKMSQYGHYTLTVDAISNAGRCRKNAYFYQRVQIACKVLFSDSRWSHLPPHKISEFCTESL